MSTTAFDDIIAQWSSFFSVPFALIKAIIGAESSFVPTARPIDPVTGKPESTASGLMQIIQSTARSLNNGISVSIQALFDPNLNIQLGTKLVSQLLSVHNGNVEQAVADYYAGQGNAYHDQNGWYQVSGGVKDYSVQTYVDRVMANYAKYSGSSVSPVVPDNPATADTGGSGFSGTLDTSVILLGLFVGVLFLRRLFRRSDDSGK